METEHLFASGRYLVEKISAQDGQTPVFLTLDIVWETPHPTRGYPRYRVRLEEEGSWHWVGNQAVELWLGDNYKRLGQVPQE